MAVSRRNSALKYYVNGRIAADLHGLTDLAGNALSAFDGAVTRAISGLKRRALPAASRAVRANYGVNARFLSGKFKLEMGSRGEIGKSGRNRQTSEYLSIWASTRKPDLLQFGGRWRRRAVGGATASILQGKRKSYAGAFRATVQGRDAIRVRKFDASKGKRFWRGPLHILRGPSPFEMLSGIDYEAARASRDAVLIELTEFYTTELRRQFKLQGGRRG